MQGKRSTYLFHTVPMEAPGSKVPDEFLDHVRKVILARFTEREWFLGRGVVIHQEHLHTFGGGSVIIIFYHTLGCSNNGRARHLEKLQRAMTDRMKRRKAGVVWSYTLGGIAENAGEGKRYPWGGGGMGSFVSPQVSAGRGKVYIRDRATCCIKVNIAFRFIQRVSMENEKRKKEEEERMKKEEEKKKEVPICVICLESTKLRLLIWTEKGKRMRRFHREKAEEMYCCSGACHRSCLQQWIEENARLLLLFKCPHCRHLCCDNTEMDMFLDGEL